MEGHGVILLLELKLLPAPPAACSGGSVRGELFGGFHFLKSILYLLNVLAEVFKRETKVWNNTATIQQVCAFFRGNFLFRQLRLACCGMTTVRKSGGHVATSRLPCRSVALQQPVLHSTASLYDYKIRERMHTFWFDAVSEGIFSGTLKNTRVHLFLHCWNAKMTTCLYKCRKPNHVEKN